MFYRLFSRILNGDIKISVGSFMMSNASLTVLWFTEIHEVSLEASDVDRNLKNGMSQSFQLELDEQEILYDQLWKDYFKSVNITERQNIKLHVQYLPKRYWRYLNEKLIEY